MWRISYKTMTLQDVLIMAYMNVLDAKLFSRFLTTERFSVMRSRPLERGRNVSAK